MPLKVSDGQAETENRVEIASVCKLRLSAELKGHAGKPTQSALTQQEYVSMTWPVHLVCVCAFITQKAIALHRSQPLHMTVSSLTYTLTAIDTHSHSFTHTHVHTLVLLSCTCSSQFRLEGSGESSSLSNTHTHTQPWYFPVNSVILFQSLSISILLFPLCPLRHNVQTANTQPNVLPMQLLRMTECLRASRGSSLALHVWCLFEIAHISQRS